VNDGFDVLGLVVGTRDGLEVAGRREGLEVVGVREGTEVDGADEGEITEVGIVCGGIEGW
jgi:hypothetical protein